ncbi:MAG: OmpA family protein [Oscillospiraceae bacterium]|nr:OmpA family protein [Oscillospiraceae bacterium]
MINTNRKKYTVRRENANYWMSYSDVMCALLLMLVLLLFFYVNRYMSLQDERERQMAEKENQLAAQELLLNETESALALKAEELAAANSTLYSQQLELTDKNLALEESLAKLAQQQLDFDTQTALLNLALEQKQSQVDAKELELAANEARLNEKDLELLVQQTDVEKLKTLLEQQTAEINQQQALINEMVGVRAEIISTLSQTLSNANIDVLVDEKTGAITLSSAIFFDYGSAQIKTSGKQWLDQFVPIYVRTLLMGENSSYVSELIIEGHTDSNGSYAYNLNLSQERAYQVVNYILGASFTGLTENEKIVLRDKVTANGRSYSEPVRFASGEENSDASRRVEFKFRLKDDEMIAGMSAILDAASRTAEDAQ